MNEIESTIDYIKTNYEKLNIGIDYSNGKDHTAITLFDKQAELVIKTLQEKLEREKGCEYCNKKTCENCGQGNQSYCNSCKHQKSWMDREISFKYWVSLHNYCPHCGRKLGEENG